MSGHSEQQGAGWTVTQTTDTICIASSQANTPEHNVTLRHRAAETHRVLVLLQQERATAATCIPSAARATGAAGWRECT